MTNIPTNQLFLLLKTAYPEKDWRRHNREYALQLTGSDVDLRVIFDLVVTASKSNGSGGAEAFLDDFGFQPHETSPGRVAYLLEDCSNHQLLVTDRSESTLPDLMANVWIQLVDIDGLVLANYLQ